VKTPKIANPLFLKLDLTSSLPDIFTTFRRMPYPVLLESALICPRLGRFSYLTADPFLVLRSKGRHVEIDSRGVIEHLESDPFLVLQALLKRFGLSPVPGLPPFQGGVIGYLAYELAHHLEKLPRHVTDDLDLPEMNIGFYDWLIAQDHTTNSTWTIATGLPEGTKEKAEERLHWISRRLGKLRSLHPFDPPPKPAGLTSNFSQGDYTDAVRAVKQYIVQGDVYQVNISQRFEASIAGEPWDCYLRLREVNPAPFAAYLHFPEVAVLSASPEEFLHLENGIVHSRPMKGTRPRGRWPEEDRQNAICLAESKKDRAENVMIVDLLRNDMGRISEFDSVRVKNLFNVERYPTVWQMTSTVVSHTNASIPEIIGALFPCGSVTGAPKPHTMEIIRDMEPYPSFRLLWHIS